jgi:hypothetical protein
MSDHIRGIRPPSPQPRPDEASSTASRSRSRRRRRGLSPWQIVSGSLAFVILLTGIVFFVSPIFYVTRAEVGNADYLTAEEIFTTADIANFHVLWVDPDRVATRVTALPNVKSAQVFIRWPARVVILIDERIPVLIWEQNGERLWVDEQGYLMFLRDETPGLITIVNEGDSILFPCTEPGCPPPVLDEAIITGALQLAALRANLDVIYYDPVRGLSYEDDRGWRGYFGEGADMEFKLVIYEALTNDLELQGIQPLSVDVGNPDAPFYHVAESAAEDEPE